MLYIQRVSISNRWWRKDERALIKRNWWTEPHNHKSNKSMSVPFTFTERCKHFKMVRNMHSFILFFLNQWLWNCLMRSKAYLWENAALMLVLPIKCQPHKHDGHQPPWGAGTRYLIPSLPVDQKMEDDVSTGIHASDYWRNLQGI